MTKTVGSYETRQSGADFRRFLESANATRFGLRKVTGQLIDIMCDATAQLADVQLGSVIEEVAPERHAVEWLFVGAFGLFG